MNKELRLTFNETSSGIDPDDLGNFLFLFRGVYEIACRELNGISMKQFQANSKIYVQRITEAANRKSLTEIVDLFEPSQSLERLQVICIETSSPLVIRFRGLVVAIAASAIIAGGEIEMPGLKAKLNPLGGGIAKLRQGLSLGQGVSTGYTVKPTTISLSQTEYKTLMIALEGQGGFQDLFGELQRRVDGRTRQLFLYPSDIDKIRRYGHDPDRGGFQARVRKVFDRHLDF